MSLKPSEERRLLELRRREVRTDARQDILAFTKYTFPKYQVNWHHRLLADKLNDFVSGKIKRLMVFMPPRHGKSELCSRRLPAFIFGKEPDAKIISASYGATLASQMNRDVQRIMDEESYRELFPRTIIPSKNVRQDSKQNYLRNSETFEIINYRGSYACAGVGGGIMGKGAKYLLIDDPFKNRKEADSITVRNSTWNWYANDAYSRLEDDDRVLVIKTLWHEDGLAYRLIAKMKSDPDADQWVILRLPLIKEVRNKEDPRKIGETLWPEKVDKKKARIIKSTAGAYGWSSIWQQNPTPPQGTIVKRSWIKYYDQLPPRFDEYCTTGDFAEGLDTGDYTVLMAWGRKGANKYLLDMVREKFDTPASLQAVRDFSEKWSEIRPKVFEKKSTGVAVIQLLQNEIPGIISFNPTDPKIVRFKAVSPDFQAGNVWFPKPKNCPWIDDVINEICGFGSAPNDDTVDTTVMALLRWQIEVIGEFTETHTKSTPTMVSGLTDGDEW